MVWHHHGSHTPTSPGAISLGNMAYHTKQIRRQCTYYVGFSLCRLEIPRIPLAYVDNSRKYMHDRDAGMDFYQVSPPEIA